MSDLKITVDGKPIGEAMNERIEKKFYEQIFSVTATITESTDDFILTTIAGSEINERKLPKERVRRAFDLLFAEDEGRITERKVGKWKQSDEDDDYVECPFCGHLTNCECKEEVWRLHYCFHCGAKNEGSETE